MSVVDERLVHLRAAGLLGSVAESSSASSRSIARRRMSSRIFSSTSSPISTCPSSWTFPAGHENPNLTIPFGTEVELVVDEQTGWITYREDALATLPAPDAVTS